MTYVSQLSLKEMSLIKLVATLCNQEDIKNLSGGCYIPSYYSDRSKLLKIETIVANKVADLPLPQEVKDTILCLIRPVIIKISNWIQFHYRRYHLKVDLPKEFNFTPQGTIDKRKTAEIMIKDENIDVTTRYTLACIYCLENDIKTLFEKMPEDFRKSFYSQEDPKFVNQSELVLFWTYHIQGEIYKMHSMIEEKMDHRCSPYQYAFNFAAIDGNKVATEHFLQKLSSTEREESLVKTTISVSIFRHFHRFYDSTEFLKESISSVLFFLLRQLNEEQQKEIFETYSHVVLIGLLDWPLQNFFMETANRMWHYSGENTYGDILLHITGKMKLDYKDYDYRKLFGEFWEQSPDYYKKHIFSVGCDRHIVCDLFKIRDKDNINLIFQHATPKDKKYMIYGDNAPAICKELINDNQLSLLKYFIKECLPSMDEVIGFKEAFQRKEAFQSGHIWPVYQMSNWQQKFLNVLDDVVCEFKKRKSEDGDSSKAKRVCSEEVKGVAHMVEI